MKCLACGKRLRPIYDDWNARKYHKQCYKTLTWKDSYMKVQCSDIERAALEALGMRYDPHKELLYSPNTAITRNVMSACDLTCNDFTELKLSTADKVLRTLKLI